MSTVASATTARKKRSSSLLQISRNRRRRARKNSPKFRENSRVAVATIRSTPGRG